MPNSIAAQEYVHTPDRGVKRPSRDRELVSYVGRHGVVSIRHVMAALGVGQAAAYRRVAACIDRGLLERLQLLRREPNLLRATRAGLSYAGLGLPVPVVSPGAVDHWLRCASTAHQLAEEFGPERVITERELRLIERLEGRPIASAKLGELPSGHPRLHRPDLVVLPPGHPFIAPTAPRAHQPMPMVGPSPAAHPRTRERGREIAGHDGRALAGAEEMRVDASEDNGMRSALAAPIAIEVELTPKAPRRLLSIVRAWRGADCVAEVRYLCEPGATRRAVDLAIGKTYASPKVRVSEVVAR